MSNQASASVAEDFTAAFLKDPTGVFAPTANTEHILLHAEHAEESRDAETPRTERQRMEINNRLRGIRSEFTFFDDGVLRVREFGWRRGRREVDIQLRHLEPRPALSRHTATKTLWLALGSALVAALAGVAAYSAVLVVVTLPVTAISTVAAAALGLLAAYRSREQVTFRTRHGKVAALTLQANLGCIRSYRALVPLLVSAMSESSTHATPDKNRRLREEMREHYRLRQAGILTPEDCDTGTRRILATFA